MAVRCRVGEYRRRECRICVVGPLGRVLHVVTVAAIAALV